MLPPIPACYDSLFREFDFIRPSFFLILIIGRGAKIIGRGEGDARTWSKLLQGGEGGGLGQNFIPKNNSLDRMEQV